MLLDDEHPPRRLVLFSRDEQKHVDIRRSLFPPDRYPQVRYFVGDVPAGQWHVFAFDMPPLAAGEIYQLWFVDTEQRWQRATTLKMVAGPAATIGTAVVDVPAGLNLHGVAVTRDVPAAPRGEIVLSGEVL